MSSLTAIDAASRTMAEKKPKRWISKATSGAHGQFRAKAEKAGESTSEFAAEHAGDSGKLGKQARLAKSLMSMSHKHKASHSLYRKKD
jgi:hypothetical protein